jgi:hypothetical protein
MHAAFVDVSPEELQQKNLQSSLETVDVKRDSADSESKEDTEQEVSYATKLVNKLPAKSVIFCLMPFCNYQRLPQMERLLSQMKMLLVDQLNLVSI